MYIGLFICEMNSSFVQCLSNHLKSWEIDERPGFVFVGSLSDTIIRYHKLKILTIKST